MRAWYNERQHELLEFCFISKYFFLGKFAPIQQCFASKGSTLAGGTVSKAGETEFILEVFNPKTK